ncbi:60S ribosomal protein L24 [Ceratobasidium theobromae]|uniref:60S ribosomal protein L24 n=1 Tax=Ceratobasidium theobromae TaxID=1582974 RepID=A0A5N5QCJ7_9AGAM|nr:60S ribosomal protein L24 [Ceratobasidium theobromae]
MKVEIDSFSGRKIYPSKGKLFVRGDSKVFRFSTSKSSSLFLQRKNPRKIAWTVGLAEETVKKRSRKTVKHQRGIVGADLAAITAKRNRTAADRAKEHATAIAKAKADKKKKEDAKAKAAAKPAGRTPAAAPKVSKQQMKGGKGGR